MAIGLNPNVMKTNQPMPINPPHSGIVESAADAVIEKPKIPIIVIVKIIEIFFGENFDVNCTGVFLWSCYLSSCEIVLEFG